MFEKKNIIFIPPLAADLEELKKSYSEGEDKDKYEILEVSNLAEANQLIPTLGSALILTSAAKTCAMMLKVNTQYLKQLKSKVILVTPQEIPEKTINKLMKVGLNDYVQCPTHQKSLIYKCNLLLQAIPTIQLDEVENAENLYHEEEEIHLGSSKFDQGHIATDEKQRIEKGVIEDVPLGEIHHEEIEDIKLDIIKTTMDNSRTRGKEIKLEFVEQEKEHTPIHEKQTNSEETLEVKSRKKITLEIKKDNPENTPRAENEHLGELHQKKTKEVELNFNRDKKTSSQDQQTDATSEQWNTKHRNQTILSIKNEEREEKDRSNDEKSNPQIKRIDDKDIDLEQASHNEEERERKTHGEIGLKKKKIEEELTIDESDEEDGSKTKKDEESDLIEALKDELDLEIAEEEKKRKTKIEEDLQQDNQKVKSKREEEQAEIERRKKEKQLLVDQEERKKTKNEEENSINYNKEKKEQLEIDASDLYKREKKEKIQEEETAKKKQTEDGLKIEEENKDQRDRKQENQNESVEVKKKDSLHLENADKQKRELIGSGADEHPKKTKDEVTLDIEKNRKGFKDEIDLDIMKGEGQVEHIDKRFKSRKHHGELKIDFEKKNRGEGDTIDYSKIKKEYKEMVDALKKLSEDELAKLRKKKDESLYSQKKIFVPHPKGVDKLITIGNIYLNRAKESEDVVIYLANMLKNEFNARMSLLCFNKEAEGFKTKYENFDEFYDRPLGKDEKWERILLVNEEKWQTYGLPTWTDESFKQESNYFIFPYYQDSLKQGYAIVHFTQNIKENQSPLIEVLMESIRGIVIKEYLAQVDGEIKVQTPKGTEVANEQKGSTFQENKKEDAVKQEKKRGLFSKLFGGK